MFGALSHVRSFGQHLRGLFWRLILLGEIRLWEGEHLHPSPRENITVCAWFAMHGFIRLVSAFNCNRFDVVCSARFDSTRLDHTQSLHIQFDFVGFMFIRDSVDVDLFATVGARPGIVAWPPGVNKSF